MESHLKAEYSTVELATLIINKKNRMCLFNHNKKAYGTLMWINWSRFIHDRIIFVWYVVVNMSVEKPL